MWTDTGAGGWAACYVTPRLSPDATSLWVGEEGGSRANVEAAL